MFYEGLKYDEKTGLIPIIAQDYKTKEVLMQAYGNKESLRLTVQTGKVHYFSRSRNKLWLKGETSGNFQILKGMYYDCDSDAVLVLIEQIGDAACHTGERSCFHNEAIGAESTSLNYDILNTIQKVVEDRKLNKLEGSYTCYLFEKGIDKILKKVGEESAETIIAAKNCNKEELANEISDLLFHLTVLLSEQNMDWEDVFLKLTERRS